MKRSRRAKKHFPQSVETRAAHILMQLQQGTHWSQVSGFAYRLDCKTTLLVYNLPAYHRLICWIDHGALHRAEVVTHEAYNRCLVKIRRYLY